LEYTKSLPTGTLAFGHLNEEEIAHVDRIINKYSDLFQLPDEPLGHTDITAYKITITDNRPINTKQYRFPLSIKTRLINK